MDCGGFYVRVTVVLLMRAHRRARRRHRAGARLDQDAADAVPAAHPPWTPTYRSRLLEPHSWSELRIRKARPVMVQSRRPAPPIG